LEPLHRIEGVAYPSSEEAKRWIEVGAWQPYSIGEMIEAAAGASASKIAIVGDDDRVSYAELDRRTANAARRYLSLGFRPGERVLVQVGVDSAAVVGLLGLLRAGLVPVCAVPQYREYEMGALARTSGAAAHLIQPGAGGRSDLLALARQLAAQNEELREIFVIGSEDPDGAVREGQDAEIGDAGLPRPSPLDVAAFQLSGGTTDVPKIIPRHHGEYLGYARAWADRLVLTADDVLLWPLPIAHNAGMLCFLLPSLLQQATLILLPKFEPESFLGTVERERVTVTGSVGPVAPRLLDIEKPERFDLEKVRLFITLNRAADIERHLNIRAANFFGITEGLLAASEPDAPASARHTTVGEPVSPHDQLRLLVPGGEKDAGEGEIGELCFRGPSTLRAYFGNPDATRRSFTSDGFFRTGDLVRLHDIGRTHRFSFEGRLKDNIDRGGEKFGTEEVELLLASHPAIQEARVVGMPDQYLGERACAFIIPVPGHPIPTVPEVGTFLLERGLAKFKLPERIEVIDEMPVTQVGKLDRRALRRRITEMLDSEGRV
jgi:non-ribosomal peptide synthetase component E (peptide arylation enzyme)